MTQNIHAQRILILDFGSQYTQLIARRVREIGVYCEIRAYDITQGELTDFAPQGIILSGGPETVTAQQTPRVPVAVFDSGVPVLGICYGLHTMAAQPKYPHLASRLWVLDELQLAHQVVVLAQLGLSS